MLQWVVKHWARNKGCPHARDVLYILVTWGDLVLSGATQPLCLSATLSHLQGCPGLHLGLSNIWAGGAAGVAVRSRAYHGPRWGSPLSFETMFLVSVCICVPVKQHKSLPTSVFSLLFLHWFPSANTQHMGPFLQAFQRYMTVSINIEGEAAQPSPALTGTRLEPWKHCVFSAKIRKTGYQGVKQKKISSFSSLIFSPPPQDMNLDLVMFWLLFYSAL